MPLAKLFVEGKLDAELFNPILDGNPVLQRGGPKNSLKPRAKAERDDYRVSAGYVRDRDFDFDPPTESTQPTIDSHEGGVPFGWRWCRHEIENYLLEPRLMGAALGWPVEEIEAAIRQSARQIRVYEAARWTIGSVRRALPPHYDLKTRPDDLNELAVPSLDVTTIRQWAIESIECHRVLIVAAMEPAAVHAKMDSFVLRFDDAFVNDVPNVLLWFSGKDILAGMADWLANRMVANPGLLRAAIRDWVIAHPSRTIELLPEWGAFVEAVRA